MITVIIKILIEFPGLLKFKCIYREQSAEDDFQEVKKLFSLHLGPPGPLELGMTILEIPPSHELYFFRIT